MSGKGGGEEGGGSGDAAFGEDGAEFFEGTVGAHAGGVFFYAQLGGDLGMGFILIETE